MAEKGDKKPNEPVPKGGINKWLNVGRYKKETDKAKSSAEGGDSENRSLNRSKKETDKTKSSAEGGDLENRRVTRSASKNPLVKFTTYLTKKAKDGEESSNLCEGEEIEHTTPAKRAKNVRTGKPPKREAAHKYIELDEKGSMASQPTASSYVAEDQSSTDDVSDLTDDK